jgi:hypothetical protein
VQSVQNPVKLRPRFRPETALASLVADFCNMG